MTSDSNKIPLVSRHLDGSKVSLQCSRNVIAMDQDGPRESCARCVLGVTPSPDASPSDGHIAVIAVGAAAVTFPRETLVQYIR